MGYGKNVLNFLLPGNHINAGKKITIPGIEVTSDATGVTTTIGGTEYEYLTKEEPKRTNTMINSETSDAEVNNAINDYNQYIKDWNQTQFEYQQKLDQLQQQNWTDEFSFEKDKYKQQLIENQLTRTREDNAVQRRMADLAMAGINPYYAGQNAAEATLGSTAGNAPGLPNFGTTHIQQLQSQASAIAQSKNSLRDYELGRRQLELDKEKINEEIRKNKENERLTKTQILHQVKHWNDELTQAGIELTNANLQAQNERELKQALHDSEWANRLIELQAKHENDKDLQKQADDAKKELQESINKIKAIETGNKIVDTIVNLAIQILEFLMRH